MARDDVQNVHPAQASGLDGMFMNTNIVLLVIFAFCCSFIALILGIVGLVVCQNPEAKQRALIVTIIGGVSVALGVVANFAGLLGGMR
jgi:uncharacterized membrane protein YjjP (DUF1212 family)